MNLWSLSRSNELSTYIPAPEVHIQSKNLNSQLEIPHKRMEFDILDTFRSVRMENHPSIMSSDI